MKIKILKFRKNSRKLTPLFFWAKFEVCLLGAGAVMCTSLFLNLGYFLVFLGTSPTCGLFKACCFISNHLNTSYLSFSDVSSLIPLWLLSMFCKSSAFGIYSDSLHVHLVIFFFPWGNSVLIKRIFIPPLCIVLWSWGSNLGLAHAGQALIVYISLDCFNRLSQACGLKPDIYFSQL